MVKTTLYASVAMVCMFIVYQEVAPAPDAIDTGQKTAVVVQDIGIEPALVGEEARPDVGFVRNFSFEEKDHASGDIIVTAMLGTNRHMLSEYISQLVTAGADTMLKSPISEIWNGRVTMTGRTAQNPMVLSKYNYNYEESDHTCGGYCFAYGKRTHDGATGAWAMATFNRRELGRRLTRA